MGMILLYEMNKDRERAMKDLARSLGHQAKTVDKALYGETLGYLAGITGFKRSMTKEVPEPFKEEMLVLSGMDEEGMELFLAAMKEREVSVSLKAVLTIHNIQWSSRKLHEELLRERESIIPLKKG